MKTTRKQRDSKRLDCCAHLFKAMRKIAVKHAGSVINPATVCREITEAWFAIPQFKLQIKANWNGPFKNTDKAGVIKRLPRGQLWGTEPHYPEVESPSIRALVYTILLDAIPTWTGDRLSLNQPCNQPQLEDLFEGLGFSFMTYVDGGHQHGLQISWENTPLKWVGGELELHDTWAGINTNPAYQSAIALAV
jgi:hypothetical protein